MGICIACVGRIKEKFYRDALAEYEKRLSRYTKLTVKEVADEPLPEGSPPAVEEAVRQKEAARLQKVIPADAYVIALDQRGRKLDSVGFSRKLEELFTGGQSSICFVIGGSTGLTDSVRKGADLLLSFSDMTFPHQLMRVVLEEQIYRAFRIMKGEPYHK